MKDYPATISADVWVTHIFSSRAAAEGGVVRRKIRDVDRIVGLKAFRRELQRRGFHAVMNADQIVIFCNNMPMRTLC
ncbi:MAG: N-(5'-phosphoribosyl)anthranilate isomerase [Halocynthiibacter sp.]